MSNYSSSEFHKDPNTPWYKILQMVPRGAVVLDFGCSSGNFGEVLIEEKNCIVDGVEPFEPDAKIAAKKLRKVYTNNIEKEGSNFLENKYDVIYFGDVIEHLVEPVKVLNQIKPFLKPSGVVMFSIPNMAHISVRLMLLEGRFEHGDTGLLDKTHLHFYDYEEIHKVFADAGYKIAKIDYIKRDIPRDVVKARLKESGLIAKSTFLNMAKQPAASAYQYVGVAKPTSKKIVYHQRPSPSPAINEFEKHIDYIKTVHRAQIKSHKERINELESAKRNLEIELESLSNSTIRSKLKNWKLK